jgi:hypothetical protein
MRRCACQRTNRTKEVEETATKERWLKGNRWKPKPPRRRIDQGIARQYRRVPRKKLDTSLFTAIVFGILTPLIALLQWNGVLSVGWKLSLAGYFVLTAIGLGAFWKWEVASNWKPFKRYGWASIMLAVLVGVSVTGVVKQYGTEHPRPSEVAKAPKQETEIKPEQYQGPRIGVQLQPGLSVDSKDIRATGAVITIWNARASVLKNSYVLLEMPPIQATEHFRSDKNPERVQILAGQKAGARFVELWSKELSPAEHHSIEVTFQRKQEVGSFNEWREKYHYGSEIELQGQYVMGSEIPTKDLAQRQASGGGLERPAIERMTNGDLRGRIRAFVVQMRDWDAAWEETDMRLINDYMEASRKAGTDEAARAKERAQYRDSSTQRDVGYKNEYNNQFAVTAIMYRDELVRRLGPQPVEDFLTRPMALEGTVQHRTVVATANYLEKLANKLP